MIKSFCFTVDLLLFPALNLTLNVGMGFRVFLTMTLNHSTVLHKPYLSIMFKGVVFKYLLSIIKDIGSDLVV